VPLHRDNGNSSEVEAVFEIYSDISQLLAHVRETRDTVALQVTAVLLALYLALFFIVRHADGVIKAQELQRRRDEESLHAARQEVIRSEQFHRTLIEHSSDAVLLLGPDLKVRYATPADARVLGLPESALAGLDLSAYACAEYRAPMKGWLDQVVTSPHEVHRIEFEGEHSEGRRYFVAIATNLSSHPAVQGLVVNIRDVTERKLAELQVRRHALYDDLTGLARRDFFIQQVHKAIARATRRRELLALMFLDLDGFKKINDTLGHHIGDLLLKGVAERMRTALRQEDAIGRLVPSDEADGRIARFGGDEFTVMIGGLAAPENVAQVARRTLDAVAAPYSLEGREITVTISIGIAIYPQDGTDADELLKLADAALYAAKSQGKNTYKFHSGPG
jgi:diguanylate cyclase (GGDEF)-like protein/PAS domain S-box-containing protein